ncbi:MAG: matrixin family metalloprotease [Aeromicrobium sp.]
MTTRRLGRASTAAALALLLPGAVTQPVTAEPEPAAMAGDAVRARQAYQVVATARARTVRTGATITIVGSVATRPGKGKARPRPVALLERKNGTWRTVARTSSTRVGAYSFAIAAGTVARTRVFRAQAARFNGLRAAATRPVTVQVVVPSSETENAPTTPPATTPTPAAAADGPEALPAGYVGLGSATDWAYLFSGGGRWDPCTTIRWAYNPSAQGYDALPDVKRAFAKISGISGLTFAYVGTTTWRFLGNVSDPAFPASTYDIGVGWADADELPALAGNVVGYGGGRGFTARAADADVKYRMDRGYLVLDNGHTLPGGYDRSGWGSVMYHEILHALGLGHAQQDVQLMYGTLSSRNYKPGAGDITGMQEIGLPAGCLS